MLTRAENTQPTRERNGNIPQGQPRPRIEPIGTAVPRRRLSLAPHASLPSFVLVLEEPREDAVLRGVVRDEATLAGGELKAHGSTHDANAGGVASSSVVEAREARKGKEDGQGGKKASPQRWLT